MNKLRYDTFTKELNACKRTLNDLMEEKELLDARIILVKNNLKIAKENLSKEIGE